MLLLKDKTLRKKQPTNPTKKEQHQNNKSKHELVHQWQEQDWEIQRKEYELYRVDQS